MNYLLDPKFLSDKTDEMKASLAKNKPGQDFTKYAAETIYQRLSDNIKRYRVYGAYWWALKDVLRRQGYDVGNDTDAAIESEYKGADDAQTIVAADLFYLDQSNKVTVDNNRWTLDSRKPDYILYDSDMEERSSIKESSLPF